MPLTATLCIDGAEDARINLHDAVTDDQPYVFVTFGGISLWADDPASFRRLADSLHDASLQLEGAQRDRLEEAQRERLEAAQAGA